MDSQFQDEALYEREMRRENPFMRHNHSKIKTVRMDYAELTLDIGPECKNTYGTVHGGMLSAMADDATGIAAHTDGRAYVTQSCSLYFLGNQSEGQLRAEAKVCHRGKTLVYVNVDITGESGKPLLFGKYCLFCITSEQK